VVVAIEIEKVSNEKFKTKSSKFFSAALKTVLDCKASLNGLQQIIFKLCVVKSKAKTAGFTARKSE
jgi:hypothetical protein